MGFPGGGCHKPRVHTNRLLLFCYWTSCVGRMVRCTCLCNLHKDCMCDCGCHGKHTLGPSMVALSWSMHIVLGGNFFQPRDMTVHLVDKFRAKVSNFAIALHCRASGSQGWLAVLQCVFGFPAWNSVQLCWLCRASQDGRNCLTTLFTIWTMEEHYIHGW